MCVTAYHMQGGAGWGVGESETRMTASVLKQDPNAQTVKKNATLIWQYKTGANSSGTQGIQP